MDLLQNDCGKGIKEKTYILVQSAAIVLMLFTANIGLTAENELELRVKSAFIYNFIQFIEWHEDKNDALKGPIKICMIGNDPLGDVLSELKERKAKGRPIQVERHTYETGSLSGYHIVVIGRSAEEKLPEILKQLSDANVLTVSDIREFAKKGGGIGLVTIDGKVKIEINSGVTLHAGLKVSAKLLEVARIVQ